MCLVIAMALYFDKTLPTPAEYVTIHSAWQKVSNTFAVCSGSPSGGAGHVNIYNADVSMNVLFPIRKTFTDIYKIV